MANQEKIKGLMEQLERGVAEVFSGPAYEQLLRTSSKFPEYSLNNQILIARQMPSATKVAGYSIWRSVGRWVRKGEKGIQIIAPIVGRGKGRPASGSRQPDEEDEEKIFGYRVAYVFDLSQTDGRPLPRLTRPLAADVDSYEVLLNALIASSALPVKFREFPESDTSKGRMTGDEIVVRRGMSQAQTLKTLIHEMAHAIMHAPSCPRLTRSTKEVQAESVAYIVSNRYGIDTSDYSFGYIARWSTGRDLAELKESLTAITATASRIINASDMRLKALSPSAPLSEEAIIRGRALASERIKLGLSAADVAGAILVSETDMVEIESGRRPPSEREGALLATLYALDAPSLAEGKVRPRDTETMLRIVETAMVGLPSRQENGDAAVVMRTFSDAGYTYNPYRSGKDGLMVFQRGQGESAEYLAFPSCAAAYAHIRPSMEPSPAKEADRPLKAKGPGM